MTTNAIKLTGPVDEEHEIGNEDRVFRVGSNWYWQSRGTSDIHGPFATLEQAEDDYLFS